MPGKEQQLRHAGSVHSDQNVGRNVYLQLMEWSEERQERQRECLSERDTGTLKKQCAYLLFPRFFGEIYAGNSRGRAKLRLQGTHNLSESTLGECT